MEETCIESIHNPTVKELLKLQKKRQRDLTSLFLVEGEREVSRALAVGGWIEKIFLSKEIVRETSSIWNLIENAQIPVTFLSKKAFEKVCYRENPDGILAVAKRRILKIEDLSSALVSKQKFTALVCVGIEKPGNLGTMMRTSDAAGVDGVILCDTHIDTFNPNVIRSSMGTIFSMPIYEASSDSVLTLFKAQLVQIVTASPDAQKKYSDVCYQKKVGLVVGKEQSGLPEKWMTAAEQRAFIPMHGMADSLNVASAAAIFLYEINRQHHAL